MRERTKEEKDQIVQDAWRGTEVEEKKPEPELFGKEVSGTREIDFEAQEKERQAKEVRAVAEAQKTSRAIERAKRDIDAIFSGKGLPEGPLPVVEGVALDEGRKTEQTFEFDEDGTEIIEGEEIVEDGLQKDIDSLLTGEGLPEGEPVIPLTEVADEESNPIRNR